MFSIVEIIILFVVENATSLFSVLKNGSAKKKKKKKKIGTHDAFWN